MQTPDMLPCVSCGKPGQTAGRLWPSDGGEGGDRFICQDGDTGHCQRDVGSEMPHTIQDYTVEFNKDSLRNQHGAPERPLKRWRV